MLVFIDDSAWTTPVNLLNSPISLDITFRLLRSMDFMLISILVSDLVVAVIKIRVKDKMIAMDIKFFNNFKL